MYGSTAAAVRRNKESHPEKYCADKRCLWVLRSGPCPKHTRNQRLAEIAEARERMYPKPLNTDDIGEGMDV